MSGRFEVRGRVFEGGTHVMGILNLTPDSFFPASRTGSDAAERALGPLGCIMMAAAVQRNHLRDNALLSRAAPGDGGCVGCAVIQEQFS